MNPVEQRVAALGASAWMQYQGRELRAYEKKAIDNATPVCCEWARQLAATNRNMVSDENFIQTAKQQLVGHIRKSQYGGISGPLFWAVVSAIVSFFVEWFLRWLFSSDENYQAVIGGGFR